MVLPALIAPNNGVGTSSYAIFLLKECYVFLLVHSLLELLINVYSSFLKRSSPTQNGINFILRNKIYALCRDIVLNWKHDLPCIEIRQFSKEFFRLFNVSKLKCFFTVIQSLFRTDNLSSYDIPSVIRF